MHRWKFSALATAAILSAGLLGTDANALTLGRVNVQSALGEPLRAEIELPQITAAEAESLRVSTANAAAFRSQGLEYSPTVGNVQVQVHRRADGSMVLRLSSSRPINEPFVDLVLDATWSSGHIVRSYTMLFDPPAQAAKPAEVTVAPQLAAPRSESAPTPPRTSSARPAAPPAAAPAAAAPRPTPRVAPAPSRAPAATEAGAGSDDTVTVRPGDTAGRIANAHRPASVSLDQMLVAMAQANPKAFVDGNVNRLRSGAVLQMPSESAAQATPASEARQIVAAQSRDFNEFRRRLAGAAPTAQVAAAERSASGSVQAQVEEAKPAAASPDKLTLSKGGVQARKADEQMARDKQADQNTARMAELSKNIAELNQLSGASTQPATPAADTSAAAPNAAGSQSAVAVPAPAGLPGAVAPAQTNANPEAPATAEQAPTAPQATPQEAAPAPAAAAAPAPKPAPPPETYEEPSFLGSLTEDPLLAGGALALVLALLGYGGYRVAQSRRQQAQLDSSFQDSGNPDSFFGASGGQHVDTADSSLTTGASSMSYSPSQLDVGGDVDPVAEADVYLAYGRDLQAEEILKEAMRHNP